MPGSLLDGCVKAFSRWSAVAEEGRDRHGTGGVSVRREHSRGRSPGTLRSPAAPALPQGTNWDIQLPSLNRLLSSGAVLVHVNDTFPPLKLFCISLKGS